MYDDMVDNRLQSLWSLVTLLCGITVVILLSLPYLRDPLIIDEAIFVSTIRSFVDHGILHYYAGEVAGWKSGLWHPPTYIYYVSVWFSILGQSSLVARLATFVFTVLTIPAIMWLTQIVTDTLKQKRKKVAVRGAVGIYVISPLVIQNGTLVDIDGSILAFAVTLFAAWVIKTFHNTVESWLYILGSVAVWFGFIAWIKFGVLPVLLITTGAYVAYQHTPWRGLQVCLAAAGGLVVFTVSWGIVASLLDLSFIAPFDHNFGSILSEGTAISSQKRLLLSVWGLYTEIMWFSPFLLGLGALAVVKHRRQLRAAPAFAFGVAALTILQYAILAKVPYGFPKYLGIATPLISVLAGVAVADARHSVTELRTWVVLGLVTVSVAIGMFLLGDPYLVPFDQGYIAVIKHTALTVGGILGLTLATGAVLYQARWAPTRRHFISAVLIVLLVGTNAGVLAHQTTADYSTRYFYGVEGTENAITATVDAYNDLSTNQRSQSVVPIDIGLYIDGRFHAALLYNISMFKIKQPPIVVLRSQKYYAVESPLLSRLKKSPNYTSKQYGSYQIFLRTT